MVSPSHAIFRASTPDPLTGLAGPSVTTATPTASLMLHILNLRAVYKQAHCPHCSAAFLKFTWQR